MAAQPTSVCSLKAAGRGEDDAQTRVMQLQLFAEKEFKCDGGASKMTVKLLLKKQYSRNQWAGCGSIWLWGN